MKPPAMPTSPLHKLLNSSSTFPAGTGALSLLLIACLVAVSSPPIVSNAQTGRQVRTSSSVKAPNGDSWTGREPDQSSESWTTAPARNIGLPPQNQNAQSVDVNQQRANSGAWILDQRTRKGYRVADLTDTKTTQVKSIDANKTQRIESIEDVKSHGQFASFDPPGYSPAQIRHAYGFDKLSNDGKGQIIGIVSAFDYPNAAADMKTFITTFKLKSMYGLPGRSPCDVVNGPHPCFQVFYAEGFQPAFDPAWSIESALDTQSAHAIAQGADILLVEAASNNLVDLFKAVDVATVLASVVSMSWGVGEAPAEAVFDPHFYNPTGVTFVASSGDSGNPGIYPAASPYVIGVGGTTLRLDRKGNRSGPETAWSGSGGGISLYELEPAYQMNYPIPFTGNRRGIPDVSMNGDPLTGNSIYNSHGFAGQVGWFELAGTSLSAPQFAGLIALANQLRPGGNLSSNSLYNSPLYDAARRDYRDNFFDIRSGSNGACGPVCTAGRGYDFVTGLGSPKADELVEALAERSRH